jgi:hypothetical protein
MLISLLLCGFIIIETVVFVIIFQKKEKLTLQYMDAYDKQILELQEMMK